LREAVSDLANQFGVRRWLEPSKPVACGGASNERSNEKPRASPLGGPRS